MFPLIAQQLLPKIGFGWTVRVMGFVMLANMVIILALARTRIPPRKAGPILELQAFREPPYVLFICGMFCIFLALYFAFSYVSATCFTSFCPNLIFDGLDTNLIHHEGQPLCEGCLGILGKDESDHPSSHVSKREAKTSHLEMFHDTSLDEVIANSLVFCRNAVGFPGRVLPAIIADAYLGPINTLIPLAVVCGILLYSWAGVTTMNSLIAFAIVFGLVNAGVQGIFMGSMTSLTKDLSKIGTRVGMALSILAFAALCGPPIAGKLIDIHEGSFLYTQMFGGTVTVVGSAFLVAARLSETGFVLRRRM